MLPTSTPIRFMYIGSLEAYQGIDLLLESFAILRRTRLDDRLIIIGGVTAHVIRYRLHAQRLGLEASVEFRGHQSVTRLAEFFGETDVLVSPRVKGSNTPMKIYSYLDSGKAIVATDLLTHTQVLTPEVAVLAAPQPAAFAAAMAALAADPARRAHLGRQARDFVRSRFSRAALANSLDTLYSRAGSILHAATHPGRACAGEAVARQPAALGDRAFDVLVIGAGIHGAATAWAAARRGLHVALIDAGDFGHAVSANSMKVVHGGLRYLQHLDLARMRESIRARSALLRFAPHLVAPRQFLMPTAGYGTRSRAMLRAALAANAVISADRNRGLPPERALARGHTLSRAACRALLPGFELPELTGGAIWIDAFAEDTERLTWEFVQGAMQAGATAVNYVRAAGLLREGVRVVGVAAKDVLGGGTFDIRAAVTVYAGGPWWSRLAPETRSSHLPVGWVRAYNLVVRRPWVSAIGAALECVTEHHDPDAVLRRSRRNLFFVPWRNGTIVGTWYKPYAGDPDACGLSVAEIQAAVQEVNQIYPAWGLRVGEVTMAHVGLVPAGAAGGEEADKRTRQLDERNGGSPGLVVLQGVKYTTGIVLGEELADRLVRMCSESELHTQGVRPPSPSVRLARADQVQDWCRGRGVTLPDDLAAGLALRYGPRFCQVLEVALVSPEKLAPIAEGVAVLAAEVRHAVRHELAVRLTDVILRRTGLGTFAAPTADILHACARIMASELNWDARRQAEEIAAVRQYYATRGVPVSNEPN